MAPPRRPINLAAFDDPQDPSVAYWIGFIAADGHVTVKRQRTVRLSLAEADAHHVEAFRDFLGSSHAIRHAEPRSFTLGGRTSAGGVMVHLSVSCAPLADKLIAYGLGGAKTHTLAYPQYEIDHASFIRGYFDGDGTVAFNNSAKTSLQVAVAGNYGFLGSLAERLHMEAGLPLYGLRPHHTTKGIAILRFGGNGRARLFHDYIYGPGGPYLERKHARFSDVLSR